MTGLGEAGLGLRKSFFLKIDFDVSWLSLAVPPTAPPGSSALAQLTLMAVSSMTNEVCFSKSSLPVNFSVTVCPA